MRNSLCRCLVCRTCCRRGRQASGCISAPSIGGRNAGPAACAWRRLRSAGQPTPAKKHSSVLRKHVRSQAARPPGVGNRNRSSAGVSRSAHHAGLMKSSVAGDRNARTFITSISPWGSPNKYILLCKPPPTGPVAAVSPFGLAAYGRLAKRRPHPATRLTRIIPWAVRKTHWFLAGAIPARPRVADGAASTTTGFSIF